jgi:hypothetical protein
MEFGAGDFFLLPAGGGVGGEVAAREGGARVLRTTLPV